MRWSKVTTPDDDTERALTILRDAGIDPRTINVPAIAQAEGKTLTEVAERTVRAHRVVLAHGETMGLT